MLYTVALEDRDAAVVHLDRKGDAHLALGRLQHLLQSGIEAEVRRGCTKLRAGVLEESRALSLAGTYVDRPACDLGLLLLLHNHLLSYCRPTGGTPAPAAPIFVDSGVRIP